MKRPKLNEIDLGETMVALMGCEYRCAFITMPTGQWDNILATAYANGWLLIEPGRNEVPVKAYRCLES